MSDFKVIETQEQLDAVLKDRLERERQKVAEKYADYDDIVAESAKKDEQIAALSSKLEDQDGKKAEYDTKISELSDKIKAYELDSVKTKVAHQVGLPFEMASRLTGEDEEAITADAKKMAKLFKPVAAPIGSNEPNNQNADPTDAAYLSMLNEIAKE